MGTRLKENPIGESIYNRIIDYDIISRKVFLSNLAEEQRILYNKYKNMINKRNSLNNNGHRENQNKKALEGMQRLRATRPKDQKKEQRKPWDMKYNEKRKMTKEEAAQIIQRQYKSKKNKEEGEAITKDILIDIINSSFDYKLSDGELKKKRGRKLK